MLWTQNSTSSFLYVLILVAHEIRDIVITTFGFFNFLFCFLKHKEEKTKENETGHSISMTKKWKNHKQKNN